MCENEQASIIICFTCDMGRGLTQSKTLIFFFSIEDHVNMTINLKRKLEDISCRYQTKLSQQLAIRISIWHFYHDHISSF